MFCDVGRKSAKKIFCVSSQSSFRLS
jgi:hypothetical protein